MSSCDCCRMACKMAVNAVASILTTTSTTTNPICYSRLNLFVVGTTTTITTTTRHKGQPDNDDDVDDYETQWSTWQRSRRLLFYVNDNDDLFSRQRQRRLTVTLSVGSDTYDSTQNKIFVDDRTTISERVHASDTPPPKGDLHLLGMKNDESRAPKW